MIPPKPLTRSCNTKVPLERRLASSFLDQKLKGLIISKVWEVTSISSNVAPYRSNLAARKLESWIYKEILKARKQ